MIPYGLLLTLFLVRSCEGLSKYPRLLVVSFDGFWSEYLNMYKNETPNMNKLHNISARALSVENVFITKTFPNHFSIATGLYEESHGIVANTFYDPMLNETFNLNDTEAKWWDTGATPIWVLNQLKSPTRHSGGMMWPGTDAIIKNQTAFYFVTYDPNMSYKNKISTVLKWYINSTHPANCVFLYFDEPDATGHQFGPNSEEMKQAVKKTDEIVGYLVDEISKSGLTDKLNVILTSDHGMAEIKPNNTINVNEILNHSFTHYGTSPILAIYPDEGKEEFVYETFKKIEKNNRLIIYKKKDIPIRFHYRNNGRIPPLLLVAKEGYDLIYESYMPNFSHPYGNHGYDNKDFSMHAFFIGFGPAFKKGIVVPTFKSVDLYPLMCHILKLTPDHHNGSLLNVITMLHDPFGTHITAVWLIVLCTLIGLCILIGFIAAIVSNSSYTLGPTDAIQHMYRSRKMATNSALKDEENTYLLVPAATDEV